MKSFNRFKWVASFTVVALIALFVFSCQREEITDPISDADNLNEAVTERSCPAGSCSFFFTPDVTGTYRFCGDVTLGASGSCTEGCNSGDQYIEVSFTANTTQRVCIDAPGTVTITAPTIATPVNVTVQFESDPGTVTDVLSSGGDLQYNTNGSCDETNSGC